MTIHIYTISINIIICIIIIIISSSSSSSSSSSMIAGTVAISARTCARRRVFLCDLPWQHYHYYYVQYCYQYYHQFHYYGHDDYY